MKSPVPSMSGAVASRSSRSARGAATHRSPRRPSCRRRSPRARSRPAPAPVACLAGRDQRARASAKRVSPSCAAGACFSSRMASASSQRCDGRRRLAPDRARARPSPVSAQARTSASAPLWRNSLDGAFVRHLGLRVAAEQIEHLAFVVPDMATRGCSRPSTRSKCSRAWTSVCNASSSRPAASCQSPLFASHWMVSGSSGPSSRRVMAIERSAAASARS